MDYSGTLESCGPVAQALLHDPGLIAVMIRQYESAPGLWGRAFESPEVLFSALRTVRNSEFAAASISLNESEMDENPNPVIFLRPL